MHQSILREFETALLILKISVDIPIEKHHKNSQ